MEDITNITPDGEVNEKEKKNRSRKRIFWTIVGLDIALAILVLYAIIDMFI